MSGPNVDDVSNPVTDGLVLYMSSVSGSVAVDKKTERIDFILTTHKIPFTSVDISISSIDKEYMHQNTLAKVKHSLPQLFKDGKYLCQAEEFEEANEMEELKQFLGIQ